MTINVAFHNFNAQIVLDNICIPVGTSICILKLGDKHNNMSESSFHGVQI